MGTPVTIKAAPLKAAAQYVGGLLVALFFVVLLSFTFSFLGTIFCATLAGMMLGALRTHKWQSIPVSLLFPLVIFALLRGLKTELGERQILLVALACFSIFWLTYAVAAALFFFERKAPSSTVPPFPIQPVGGTQPGSRAEKAPVGRAESSNQNGQLSLEMLAGTWSLEPGTAAQLQNRRISIQKERLTLSVVDSSGQTRVLASARVKLCAADSGSTLLVCEPGAEAGSDTPVRI
jgi:hypothetical protein